MLFIRSRLQACVVAVWVSRGTVNVMSRSSLVLIELFLISRHQSNSPLLPTARCNSALGIAYAGLGRKDEAIREGKKAVELYPVSKDADEGQSVVLDLAVIYTMVGEYEAALDEIEYLLSIPSETSVPWLRLDPIWDPLREHPRFQELLEKYAID